MAGVPVILFKYHSESVNNLVSKFIAEVKINKSCFSSLVNQQISSREIQTKYSWPTCLKRNDCHNWLRNFDV